MPECVHAPSCPALCYSMDCSLLGASVHGILQARILELVAIFTSRESSYPVIEITFPALQADPLSQSHLGSPIQFLVPLYKLLTLLSNIRKNYPNQLPLYSQPGKEAPRHSSAHSLRDQAS